VYNYVGDITRQKFEVKINQGVRDFENWEIKYGTKVRGFENWEIKYARYLLILTKFSH
jgi:hypothetical protein